YVNFEDATVPDPNSTLPFERIRQYLDRGQTPVLELVGTETRAQPTLPDDDLLRPTQQRFHVPAVAFRFDLEPGERYDQSYRTEQFFGDNRVGAPSALRTTFVGRESVTVPAGRFDTC